MMLAAIEESIRIRHLFLPRKSERMGMKRAPAIPLKAMALANFADRTYGMPSSMVP
jgi:hypothetical protein